jgi:hypothetical protein
MDDSLYTYYKIYDQLYLVKHGYCTGWLRSLILSTSPRNLDLDEVKTSVEQ